MQVQVSLWPLPAVHGMIGEVACHDSCHFIKSPLREVTKQSTMPLHSPCMHSSLRQRLAAMACRTEPVPDSGHWNRYLHVTRLLPWQSLVQCLAHTIQTFACNTPVLNSTCALLSSSLTLTRRTQHVRLSFWPCRHQDIIFPVPMHMRMQV